MIEHRAFFGDGEKRFALPTRELIEELERKTGHGLMGLFNRAVRKEISFGEAVEILRITLIGGGTAPAEADSLVRVYSITRHFMETFGVVDGVLATLFFGNEDNAQDEIRQAAATDDFSAAINDALKQVAE
jgi:hypothetical protein